MADQIVSSSQHAAVVSDLNKAKGYIASLEKTVDDLIAEGKSFYTANHVLVAFAVGVAAGAVIFGLVL